MIPLVMSHHLTYQSKSRLVIDYARKVIADLKLSGGTGSQAHREIFGINSPYSILFIEPLERKKFKTSPEMAEIFEMIGTMAQGDLKVRSGHFFEENEGLSDVDPWCVDSPVIGWLSPVKKERYYRYSLVEGQADNGCFSISEEILNLRERRDLRLLPTAKEWKGEDKAVIRVQVEEMVPWTGHERSKLNGCYTKHGSQLVTLQKYQMFFDIPMHALKPKADTMVEEDDDDDDFGFDWPSHVFSFNRSLVGSSIPSTMADETCLGVIHPVSLSRYYHYSLSGTHSDNELFRIDNSILNKILPLPAKAKLLPAKKPEIVSHGKNLIHDLVSNSRVFTIKILIKELEPDKDVVVPSGGSFLLSQEGHFLRVKRELEQIFEVKYDPKSNQISKPPRMNRRQWENNMLPIVPTTKPEPLPPPQRSEVEINLEQAKYLLEELVDFQPCTYNGETCRAHGMLKPCIHARTRTFIKKESL